MSSQSRATRESQKRAFEARLQARQGILEKRGLAPPDFRKDKVYQHLKARHEAIVSAIAVIEALAHKAQPAGKPAVKAESAPAPAEKKPKKEKAEKPAKTAKAPAAEAGK